MVDLKRDREQQYENDRREPPQAVSHRIRDSGSQRHADTTFAAQSAAAMTPGAGRPSSADSEPMTGPIMMPTDVADESQPSARARPTGSTESPT